MLKGRRQHHGRAAYSIPGKPQDRGGGRQRNNCTPTETLAGSTEDTQAALLL